MPLSRADLLNVLQRELLFLESGGYRTVPWRPMFLLEDSPTCPKKIRPSSCGQVACPWLTFVPQKHRNEPVPCRYICLTECGQNIDVLYRTATQEEYEETFRDWLLSMISMIEHKHS
jgi:hypothetical protein